MPIPPEVPGDPLPATAPERTLAVRVRGATVGTWRGPEPAGDAIQTTLAESAGWMSGLLDGDPGPALADPDAEPRRNAMPAAAVIREDGRAIALEFARPSDAFVAFTLSAEFGPAAFSPARDAGRAAAAAQSLLPGEGAP
jgi:hypothetical protein